MKNKKENEAQKQFQRKRKFEAIQKYGGECICCGEDNLEMLTIMKRIGKAPVTTQLHNWLQKHKYPKGYIVKCANCEIAKKVYGICPHESDRKLDAGTRFMIAQSEYKRVETMLNLTGK